MLYAEQEDAGSRYGVGRIWINGKSSFEPHFLIVDFPYQLNPTRSINPYLKSLLRSSLGSWLVTRLLLYYYSSNSSCNIRSLLPRPVEPVESSRFNLPPAFARFFKSGRPKRRNRNTRRVQLASATASFVSPLPFQTKAFLCTLHKCLHTTLPMPKDINIAVAFLVWL